MIEIVPIELYYAVFLYFGMFLVLAIILHSYSVNINSNKNLKFLKTSGLVLLVLVILYIGLRPLSGLFGDMGAYRGFFVNYSRGADVTSTKDVMFHYYMKSLSSFVTLHTFFLITAILYIFPMYLISKKHFKDYWFYAFIMFVVSFSFYSYGTNGIRNGMATSFFLWGLCYPNNKIKMSLFFIFAILFHKTLILPIAAYVITLFYNNPKSYIKIWVISIPISLFLGGVFISIFTALGFGDDRLAGYLQGESVASNTFRWDFLFYSAFPVFSGWYFIIKKNFKDVFYNSIFGTYLICNAFWVLVIRANFSNRFAYLSWFMMAFVIIYPLLKKQFFKNQQIIIAKVVTAYFMFTYLMYIIYYG
ncbi:MAG: EpsG family protein [Algibacter sp.]